MHFRNREERHIAEDAGEAEEVLILKPTACAPAVDAAGELIFTGNEILGQFKRMRRKGIAGEADIMAVQPDRNAAFCARKSHKDSLTRKILRNGEVLGIAGNRIILGRDLVMLHVLIAFPRILDVDVLRDAVAFHLDMRRNDDIRPGAAIKIRRLKARNHLRVVERMVELPMTVEAHSHGVFTREQLLFGDKRLVIGKSRNTVLAKVFGVLDAGIVKAHSQHLLLFFVV